MTAFTLRNRFAPNLAATAAPVLLVLIWSSGFIVARFACAHAASQLFLLARMSLAAALQSVLVILLRLSWPTWRHVGLHLSAGALLNGIYLCVNWWAVEQGMPAGVISLLGALQPLIVAIGAFAFLGEKLPLRRCVGLATGLAGVLLVLLPVMGRGQGAAAPSYVVLAAFGSVFAISAGTMVQSGSLKRDEVLVSGAIQNVGGAIVAIAATYLQGSYRWDGSAALWISLLWSVAAISMSAISLLVWLTREQGATRVSLLMLLPPPLAAVEAWILFDEKLSAFQMIGFALALGGVLLARSRTRDARTN